MKIKVSDYVAGFFVKNGIKTIFTVVGGGAMHLNDSFGHCNELHCVYNHHEQASAIAAEAYARVNQEIAAVCVTSGPGAINALNGVAGAYMDSIPMLVVSGQTKTTLTVKHSGLDLRSLGNQEFDIVSSVGNMTKYAEMIMEPEKIRYCLEKALYLAKAERPGPCWLDIPLDIQGFYVETEELEGYYPDVVKYEDINEKIEIVLEKLKVAKRPVFYAGNGIRLAKGIAIFRELVERLCIPVVTCWDSIDLIETEHECYVGRGGTMGDRAGNFAVQNSDLLIVVGSRLNIYQVGYNVQSWAREAYSVVVDVDREELKKPTIRVDLPICCDAKWFMEQMLCKIGNGDSLYQRLDWQQQCMKWKEKYPVVQKKHYSEDALVNSYAFVDILSRKLSADMITVVANGSASVVGSQSYHLKRGQRFLMNCGLSSMGYDLPAAIGACVANECKPLVCIAGDGSIQMNLQELQTIVTNRLPVKIFVLNNQGYHQIRLTQNNIFKNKLVGVGSDSGDLGFPDFEKLAYAYGIPYRRIETVNDAESIVDDVLRDEGYQMCEICCSKTQIFEPKSATRRLEDGTLISPPLEDMAPFLDKEELEENMYIREFKN